MLLEPREIVVKGEGSFDGRTYIIVDVFELQKTIVFKLIKWGIYLVVIGYVLTQLAPLIP